MPSIGGGLVSSSANDYAEIVKQGLTLYLDAGYKQSYPGTGTSWTNLSTSGTSNATLVNGISFNSENKGSLVFDGIDDYCTIGSDFFISTSSPFTAQIWVRMNPRISPEVVFHRILTLRASGTTTLGIAYASSAASGYNGLYFTANTGWARATSGYHPAANVWGLLTLSYNGSGATTVGNFSLYWNTTSVSISTDGTSTPAATNDANYIGVRQPSDNQWLRGRLGMVSIYNKVLSSSERIQNYNALRTRYGI